MHSISGFHMGLRLRKILLVGWHRPSFSQLLILTVVPLSKIRSVEVRGVVCCN